MSTSDDSNQRETQSYVILIENSELCDFSWIQTTLLFWFLRFYSEVYCSAYRIEHSDFTVLLDCYIQIYIYIYIYMCVCVCVCVCKEV